jgi:hypothetical protein
MQKSATGKFHNIAPSANAEDFRTKVELVSDCSPAEGITAAFDFAERRHVPLAALE